MKLCLFFSSFLALTTLISLTPDQAFKKLQEGNKRYRVDQLTECDQTTARRKEVLARQKPFSVVIGCSDSRVPPEMIFDQGLGDLFTVRVAGNVIGEIELETIKFACLKLGTPLVLVLGHQNCGAIEASLQGDISSIPSISKLIDPAIKKVKKAGVLKLEFVVKENVKIGVEFLKKDKDLQLLVSQKKLKVVGGYYSLENGTVTFLDGEGKS